MTKERLPFRQGGVVYKGEQYKKQKTERARETY